MLRRAIERKATGMADAGIMRSWDDLEDWVRRDREAEVPRGNALTASLAVSFVGQRPDIFVETKPLTIEDGDDIVEGLVEFFGYLRPERLAVIWPSMFTLDDGSMVLAVRLNLAEPDGNGRWRWTTRVVPYRLDPQKRRRIAEWGPSFALAKPPDAASQGLRRIYRASTHRRLLRRGSLKVPPRDGWHVACHPESTTMDALERAPGATIRNGRLVRGRR